MSHYYLALDTETGGLNPLTNSLNEIAACIFDQEGIIHEKFEHIVNPFTQNKSSSLYALKLSTMLERNQHFNEVDNQQVALEFSKWLIMTSTKYNPVLVGHNLKFDLEFIEKFLNHYGFEKPFEIFSPHTIDTVLFGKILSECEKIKSKKMNLGALCEEFEIKNDQAHTAMSDVLATMQLFLKFISLIK